MAGEGIPSADELSEVKERYEDGTSSVLYVVPPEGSFSFSVEELCAIRKWYSVTRVTHPEFKNTVSTFDIQWPVRVKEHTIKYQSVLQLDCDAKKTFRDLREVKKILDESPWPTLRDKKDRLSLLFSFTYHEAEGSNFGSFDPKIVDLIRKTVEEDLQKIIPRSKMHWVGMADYQWYVRKGFQFSLVVNTAMILLLIFSLRFLYGTWRSGLLFCFSLLLNGIWIYGAKAIAGSAYDVLSSGLFLILGVSAIEDFTFLSSAQLKGSTWKQSIQDLLVPSFFTSLTTMIGFISLCASDLAVIRRFGLWCAAGALLEWIMLFVFLPAFLSGWGVKRSWVNPQKAHAHLVEKFRAFSLPKWATVLCLGVFPLAVFSFPRLNVNDDPSAIFPSQHPYNIGLQEIRETKGWMGSVSLIHSQAESTSSELDRAASQLTKATAFETPHSILTWLNQTNTLLPDDLRIDYQSSLSYRQLVDANEIPRAILYLKDITVDGLQALKAEAQKICPNGECHLAGDLIAYSDFSTYVPKTLIESMAVSLVLVALIIGFLTLAFGKGRLFFVLIASSFWGPCLTVVILAALHIPMDFMKCIVASVLVGLTGDNAVQYLFAAGKSDLHSGIHSRGGASILTNVLMALTALMYLGSYFNPPKSFGLILSTGLIVSLIGDLWLLNGLLNLFNFRLFNYGRKRSQ